MLVRADDVFDYLPAREPVKYRKGQEIHAGSLCLVVSGRVEVSTQPRRDNGRVVVTEILGKNDLFGEGSVFGDFQPLNAVALDDTVLMSWPAREIESLILARPRLGLALLQVVVAREEFLLWRLKSGLLESVSERVSSALDRLAKKFGTVCPDGSVEMPPLTHDTLAAFIGSSREIVNTTMSGLRRLGLVRYSRRGIVIYPEALQVGRRELIAKAS